MGDFNIAPEDRDVVRPGGLARARSTAPTEEREHFRALLGAGPVRRFRLFEQPPKSCSWWDYRNAGVPARTAGLRIDHILVSERAQARGRRRARSTSVPRKNETAERPRAGDRCEI